VITDAEVRRTQTGRYRNNVHAQSLIIWKSNNSKVVGSKKTTINKTKVLLPLFLSVPGEIHHVHTNLYIFYYYHWVDISAGGVLIHFSNQCFIADMVYQMYLVFLQILNNGIRVTRSLVFCLIFCRSLFVLLYFFCWSLCYLFFFWLPLWYLQALLIIKTKVLLPKALMTFADLGYSVFRHFGIPARKLFNYLSFQFLNSERTCWKLYQKRFHIYLFLISNFLFLFCFFALFFFFFFFFFFFVFFFFFLLCLFVRFFCARYYLAEE
jgi:hypothetical protein